MNKYLSVVKKIHIHPLFWLVALLSMITANFRSFFLLFFIVLVHELGHTIAATYYSWRIKRVMLLPFGGVAEMDEHGNRPLLEELVVILAGPLQHFFLLVIAFGLYSLDVLSLADFNMFWEYNFFILLMNLLPIFPLDGGKLLFLLLSAKLPFSKAHRYIIVMSWVFVSLCVGLLCVYNFTHINSWLILFFLSYSLFLEWKQHPYVMMRFLLERHYGKNVEYRKVAFIKANVSEPLLQILKRFYRGQKHRIVVEHNSLDENELLYAYFSEKRVTDTISTLIR